MHVSMDLEDSEGGRGVTPELLSETPDLFFGRLPTSGQPSSFPTSITFPLNPARVGYT